MTFGRLQRIFLKITPKKPAEEGNDWKEVSEASAPQNDRKQLCPPGNPSTSEKIHETSGNREAQEKEERQGRAHQWSSQNTHNIDRLRSSSSVGPKRGEHAWTHRLRERKQVVIYEEISDPEEDDE
ncbi:protein SSX2-like [Nomascus leucogenys]|uniref:protein SSX2-like n=1 Tax=Nomascus leucogenys TaxID=61853 RepID=UPI00122D7F4E|nr:protein SSX2-like [Nomascus leucogenys]